jgi:hypothetical protein
MANIVKSSLSPDSTVSKMEIVQNEVKLDTKNNDIAKRLTIAESLFGILPSTITDKDIEDIKEERLRCGDE